MNEIARDLTMGPVRHSDSEHEPAHKDARPPVHFARVRDDELGGDEETRALATDRRRFLQWMGASLALAGAGGCRVSQPKESIVPHVRSREYVIPGKPLYFATALTLGGYATGVLVESHEGRPTKIEGNPEHPASMGATCPLTQAAILSLYDPDRSQVITHRGQVRTWTDVIAAITEVCETQRQNGAGIRVLTESVTSPTLIAQVRKFLQMFPRAAWHQYGPIHRDNAYDGAEMAFGERLETRYYFDRADVVVSLDADFLDFGPGRIRYARDWMKRRALPPAASNSPAIAMPRLCVVETSLTNTGSMADRRLALRPHAIEAAANYLARATGVQIAGEPGTGLPAEVRRWLDQAASDLRDRRGAGLVVAGDWQPSRVHALAHAINSVLGNTAATVEHTRPVSLGTEPQVHSLKKLVADAAAGTVDLLVICGGNPAFDAPVDVEFARALERIGLTVRLGLYDDETSALCDWHVPAAHELESWTDARAFDGTVTIMQPLIAPMYDGKTAHELVAVMLGERDRTSYSIVRETWLAEHGEAEFEQFWRKSLHDGVVPDTRFPAWSGDTSAAWDLDLKQAEGPASFESTDTVQAGGQAPSIDIVFRPDPSIYDGRFANNAWLQELPKPITKLTWDNAALISPATAARLRLSNGQMVSLCDGERSLTLPVWVVPGHADGGATVHIGYGRSRGGQLAVGAGFNAYAMRAATGMWSAGGVLMNPIGRRHPMACTQPHHRMEGRNLIRTATLSEFQRHPDFAQDHSGAHTDMSLYPTRDTGGDYAWGMSINLNTCTGCNACIIACQAENNIPVVGKDEVVRGREMHWIRLDQYFSGAEETVPLHQPVTCMHCENAPCEVVCPVAATVHSAEGLNEMVYNRCVGTRYCSNNCPYKVRRFNFLKYTDDETPVLKLGRNPDVTVRSRGVMEKCTYCVQRINAARIEAKKENERIRDGAFLTACEAACPTQAIVFGDAADPASRVSQLKRHPLNYGLLTELNTRPRTTYLARINNP